MPPRVSVIVPVHDRRALLAQLLAGLSRQTFTDFEVVVADDGSTDGSADEAEAAAAAGLPVRTLRLTDRGGAVAARRAAVAVARGDVLAFTDSDCVPSPGWLEAALQEVDAGAALVQGLTRPMRPVGPLERSVWAEREDGLYATCNVVYRRTAFDEAGGFIEDGSDRLGFRAGAQAKGLGFGEDTLLGWRVRRRGRVTFVPSAVVEHAVLPFDGRAAVSRAWQAGGFPALVGEVPELRAVLLDRRVFLGRRAQLALIGAVLAVASRRPAVAALLVGVWARHHLARVDRASATWTRDLAVLLGLEVVTEVALVVGSIRTRVLVL